MTLRHKGKTTSEYVWTGTDLVDQQIGINIFDGSLHIKRSAAGGGAYVALRASTGPLQEVHDLIAAATGTTTIPYDSTTPLITEGTQILSDTITMAKITNHINFFMSMSLEVSTKNKAIIISMFRDSTCIGSIPVFMAGTDGAVPFTWEIFDEPATLSAITYTVRIGVTGGTWRVNTASTGNLGGTIVSAANYSIKEHRDD